MKKEIKFTKRRLNNFFYYGSLWLLLGGGAVYFDSSFSLNYGYIVIGVLFVGTSIYERIKKYLTIEDGVLTKNRFPVRSIKLEDITDIRRTYKNCILTTIEGKELKINMDLIEEDSLVELNFILDNLDF